MNGVPILHSLGNVPSDLFGDLRAYLRVAQKFGDGLNATVIVSREDEAGLTRRRIKKLIGGRREYSTLEDRMLVNITGQVRALDSLREMLGLVGPQPGERSDGEGEGDSKPQIYVAKWMRRAGESEPEDVIS